MNTYYDPRYFCNTTNGTNYGEYKRKEIINNIINTASAELTENDIQDLIVRLGILKEQKRQMNIRLTSSSNY